MPAPAAARDRAGRSSGWWVATTATPPSLEMRCDDSVASSARPALSSAVAGSSRIHNGRARQHQPREPDAPALSLREHCAPAARAARSSATVVERTAHRVARQRDRRPASTSDAQVLLGGELVLERRHVADKERLARRSARIASGAVGAPCQRTRPSYGRRQPGQDAQQRRLAAAVGAGRRPAPAPRGAQRQVGEQRQRPASRGEVVRFEHRVGAGAGRRVEQRRGGTAAE